MLSIVLNEALFDATTGRKPWNKMSLNESKAVIYLLESTEAEIGALPLIPTPRTAQSISGQPGVAPGANAFRSIEIRRFQPTNLDEAFIRPQTAISGNINLVGKITSAISDGIIVVTCTNYTSGDAMTAEQFYDYMLNWTV